MNNCIISQTYFYMNIFCKLIHLYHIYFFIFITKHCFVWISSTILVAQLFILSANIPIYDEHIVAHLILCMINFFYNLEIFAFSHHFSSHRTVSNVVTVGAETKAYRYHPWKWLLIFGKSKAMKWFEKWGLC